MFMRKISGVFLKWTKLFWDFAWKFLWKSVCVPAAGKPLEMKAMRHAITYFKAITDTHVQTATAEICNKG